MTDRVAPLPVLPPSHCPGRELQKAMEVMVRENLFRTISDAWKDRASGLVSLKDRELTVTFSDPAMRDEFFDWLKSRKPSFPDAPPTVDSIEQVDWLAFGIHAPGVQSKALSVLAGRWLAVRAGGEMLGVLPTEGVPRGALAVIVHMHPDLPFGPQPRAPEGASGAFQSGTPPVSGGAGWPGRNSSSHSAKPAAPAPCPLMSPTPPRSLRRWECAGIWGSQSPFNRASPIV